MAIKLMIDPALENLEAKQLLTFKDLSVVSYGNEDYKARLTNWAGSGYSPVDRLQKVLDYFKDFHYNLSDSCGAFQHCIMFAKMRYKKTIKDAVNFTTFENTLRSLNNCISEVASSYGKEGALKKIEKAVNSHLKHLQVRKGGRGKWEPKRSTILFPSDVIFSKWEKSSDTLDGYADPIIHNLKICLTTIQNLLKQVISDEVKDSVLRDRVAYIDAVVKLANLFKDVHVEWRDVWKSAQP